MYNTQWNCTILRIFADFMQNIHIVSMVDTMLIEFNFKNYRSYRDHHTFSMVASADKDLLNNTIETNALGKIRLNRSAVIYGANASGKSNLIEAIGFVEEFIRTSAERTPNWQIPVKGFVLDKSTRDKPSEFEVTFLCEDVRYEYGFIVDHKHVYEEWLIAYPKGSAQVWFERTVDSDSSEGNWYFGRRLKGEKNRLVPLTRPNALFLSVSAQFNHEQLKPIYDWFVNKLMIVNLGDPPRLLEHMAVEYLSDNPDIKKDVRNLLRYADLGIIDFSIEETSLAIKAASAGTNLPNDLPEELTQFFAALENVGEKTNVAQKSVQMYHQSDDHKIPISFDKESFGTRRLFALAPLILHSLKRGSVLFIDELDSSLHPLLVRALVQKFHDPKTNPGNAQLIFNTHDTTLLDQTLFRRDQIWFTEKSVDGATQLYSLLEYKPRKSEALSKGYLQGRYGAVPFLDTVAGL